MLAPRIGPGDGVRGRLRSEFGALTPAQQRLAAFLLDNLTVASDYTITDLAEAAGVSIGTISQLCRRLGLKGYQDLRLGLARDAVVLEAGAAGRSLTMRDGSPAVVEAVARVFGSSQEALADTVAGLDLVALELAMTRLAGARRIEAAPIHLGQRRVYILPTLQGITFGMAIVLMLIGSVNYALSLGFLECVAGPLVRSSYRAEQALARNNAGLGEGGIAVRG